MPPAHRTIEGDIEMTRAKPRPVGPLFEEPTARPMSVQCRDKSRTPNGWTLICRLEDGHEGEHRERFCGDVYAWPQEEKT
jgi:hypothetical protein